MENKLKDIEAKRRALIEDLTNDLKKRIKAQQRALYSRLVEYLLTLDLSEGSISYTSKNLTKSRNVALIIQTFTKQQKKGLTAWIYKAINRLFKLNTTYFSLFSDHDKKVDDKALELIMQRLGFKGETLIKGGWLDSVTNNTGVAEYIGVQINRAIAANMPLKTFRAQFKTLFTGNLGVLERHYNTNTFDLFQDYDRSIQKVYADELELNYALYAGTIKDNTRPFCKARVQKVFSRKQIASWKDLNFQGKPKVYDPFTQCGGYNCRHHLSWVSNEIAETLRDAN